MLTKRAGRTLLWLGGGIAALIAPAAQVAAQNQPSFGSAGVYREDPATALGRYLRVITANPRDLEALTGAGRAALQVGDAQAAIGFYARAEAISPRNGRIKAGLGSALVLLNQEQAALRYFDDATGLGVPEADLASDRGLAHDLRGSSKRAQRDYAIALRRGDDPEATRRMALSLAIGGERDAALTLLDPLLRKQDTAAWRARAFILAMTGDSAGASRAAEAVMSSSAAAGFAPFFRKLPTLKAGEKAAAVHFGNFPGEGRPMRIDDLFNQAEVAARVALENTPRSTLDAGAVDGSQGAFGRLAARAPADGEGQLTARIAPRPSAVPRSTPAAATPRPNATLPRAANPSPAPGASLRTRIASGAQVGAASGAVVQPGFGSAPVQPPVQAPTTPAPTRLADISATILAAAQEPLNESARTAAATIASPIVAPVPTPILVPLPTSPTAPALSTPLITIAAPNPVANPVTAPPTSLAMTVALPPSSSPQQPDLGLRLGGLRELLAGTSPPAVSLPDAGATSPASITMPVVATTTAVQLGSTTVPPSSVAADGLASPTPSAPPAPRPKVETPAAPPVRGTTGSANLPPPAPRPKVENPSSGPTDATARVEISVESSRVWVQIAGGADEKAFPSEWRRLKTRAPELLDTQTAWTTPLKATNRLLVGPFANEREAQEFVNKLKPRGITAFAWTSAADQKIARVAAR